MADPVNVTNIKHEYLYRQGGQRDKVVTYTFFIGNHGPFIEQFPDDDKVESAFRSVVQKLQTRISLAGTR